MRFEKFEDIIVWQKDYNFIHQILRAVVSIMNNLAEGFERRANKEFVNFL